MLRRSRWPPRRARLLTLALIAPALALALVLALLTLLPASASSRPAAPDFVLEDQTGQPLRLADLRGTPVLLTFVYTHCPDVCPLYLSQIRRAIASGAAPPDLQVLVVTVDPERDTPERLRAYAEAWPRGWRFLSGAEARLRQVWADYQVRVEKVAVHQHLGSPPSLAITHTARLLLIDREGRVEAELRGQGWSVAELQTVLAQGAPPGRALDPLVQAALSWLAALLWRCRTLLGGDPAAAAALLGLALLPGLLLPALLLRLLWGRRVSQGRS